MSSIKFATQLHTEPEAIEAPIEETSNWEGKEKNGPFSINFEALGKVLARQDEEQEAGRQDACQSEAEALAYNEIRRKDYYRFSTTSGTSTKTQRIILYSPSFENTFQATCFRDLDILDTDLPSIFSEELGHLWWLDVQNPSEEELRLLCSGFRIHPLTVEDILNREIQEKIEDFTHYYFASFRSYLVVDNSSGKAYKPYTIYMVVFHSGILSFCFDESEHANHVLQRIKLLKDYVYINSDWIFYAFV